MSDATRLERFLAFSAEVTAFSTFDLRGTGQADAYLSAVVGVVGDAPLAELLDTYGRVRDEAGQDPGQLANVLRRDIFSDAKLGPIARNIIKLWYVGTWYELPPEWSEAFGALERNFTFMVSPAAYTEGLLWPAIGANPPGAKAPGFGSWAEPPQIPTAPEGAP
jgi:hypothetical protein